MRVSGVASFYDASSRINGISRLSKVESVKDVEKTQVSSSSLNIEESKNDYAGVKQTLVSPDNAYQKQMLEDKEFAMMRLAGKLMDKLPAILDDMKKVSDRVPEEINKTDTTRIIINENSHVDYAGNAKQELENIPLQ